MSTSTIRRATPKDMPTLDALNHALFVAEHAHYDKTINVELPFSRAGKAWLRKRLRSKKSILLVAEVEKHVVGYITGSVNQGVPYMQKARYGSLDSFYVDPAYRNKGLGRALLNAFDQWVKQNKLDSIEIIVSAKNSSALRLYKRHGYFEADRLLRRYTSTKTWK